MKSLKMVMIKLMTVFMLIEVITCQFGFGFGADGGLSMNYYLMSCPFVEPVVKNIVNRALDNDPTLAAALIRMHFHDCFIQVLLSLLSFSRHNSLTLIHMTCCVRNKAHTWSIRKLFFKLLLHSCYLLSCLLTQSYKIERKDCFHL